MTAYKVRLLVDPSEKQNFKASYESASGLLLPDHYLYANQVFGLVKNERIIGGFILGATQPLRTYTVFADEMNWRVINSRLGQNSVCEICCLWLARKYWNWLTTSFLWFNAARIVSSCKEDMVVFGTISRGNMILYGSTLHAQLIHCGQVDIQGSKKKSWIYGIPVRWFFIDINWGLAVRLCHHILKLVGRVGSRHMKSLVQSLKFNVQSWEQRSIKRHQL